MTLADREAAAPAAQWRRDTVLIIEDHALVARGLSVMLRENGLDAITVDAPDVDEILALARRHRPLLAMVDLQFKGSMTTGLDLIVPLSAVGVPVLIVSGVADQALLGACLEAGAAGVASKTEDFDRLLERVAATIRSEPVNSPREREELLDAARDRRAGDAVRLAPFRALTGREAEVLDLLVRGHAADGIARRMFVSVPTVRTHIQAILRKLGVNSQLAAVALVHEAGWKPSSACPEPAPRGGTPNARAIPAN